MCNYILWWAKEDWRTSDFHVSEIHACDALHWSTGTIYNLPTSMDNWREFRLIQRRCNYNQWNGCFFFFPWFIRAMKVAMIVEKMLTWNGLPYSYLHEPPKKAFLFFPFFFINKPVILGNRCHCRYGACLHFYFKTWVIEHIVFIWT